MYLKRIVIENFRGIEALDLELGPGLNVLVGENNVGKTTVLDALRACLGAAASGSDALRLTPDDRRLGGDGQPLPGPIKVDVFFAGLTEDEQAEFIDALNYDPATPAASTASVHLRWSYDDLSKRHHVRRWGGNRTAAEAQAPVPDDVMQGVPVTLLAALRDAVTALAPGRQSRLGRLLGAEATPNDKAEIEAITKDANAGLDGSDLIQRAARRISKALEGASGEVFAQTAQIQASEPSFDRIVGMLQIVLRLPGVPAGGEAAPVMALRSNGLGFNNLLYIGTVVAELQATPAAQASLPLLLVEEPEAHLHPQLQILLANYLAGAKDEAPARPRVQTLVTTHSPTIAAHVPAKAIHVLHRAPGGGHRCVSLGRCGLGDREAGQLRRMFDVTRATLLFARGVILVEGIAEMLLLPILARRLGHSLEDKGISVIQVAGVDFRTPLKLFGPGRLELPVAVVTDGDPGVDWVGGERTWAEAQPKRDAAGLIQPGPRTAGLLQDFGDDPGIKVFHSAITLEHALAAAGEPNPYVMCRAWAACFDREPRTFTADLLAGCNDQEARALVAWRGICLASSSGSKGAFAQALADELTPERGATPAAMRDAFRVPVYLEQAIEHVLGIEPVERTVAAAAAATPAAAR